ncbi:MAG: UbiA-like polyprenyltransferase [Eubacteriales bacterium]|nr:UbiA-like polyprenyltransferase [Eubacteriales bacterium]MDZ7610425.1 UbiA-like polyprenyltransferase [Eubacteriales bacterium]
MREMGNLPLENRLATGAIPGSATGSRPFNKVRVFLDMIKFEHTVFALPFAFIGALLVQMRIPGLWDIIWITVAMVGARTAAMSLNRIFDRHIDARNPRTADRALPKGLLSVNEVCVHAVISMAVLLFAAIQLSPLAVKLFPLVLFILVGYSYTKRFTWACHLWLGVALGFTPVAGWIAISDAFALPPVLLGLGVMFWVAGFDIIYASMDYEFDRDAGIRSIPARFGIPAALKIAAGFHILAPAFLAAAGMVLGLGTLYYIGIGLAILILGYQHAIVKPNDLSRANVAFFQANAVLGMTVFAFTLAEVLFH